jgi:hypothetical protein
MIFPILLLTLTWSALILIAARQHFASAANHRSSGCARNPFAEAGIIATPVERDSDSRSHIRADVCQPPRYLAGDADLTLLGMTGDQRRYTSQSLAAIGRKIKAKVAERLLAERLGHQLGSQSRGGRAEDHGEPRPLAPISAVTPTPRRNLTANNPGRKTSRLGLLLVVGGCVS